MEEKRDMVVGFSFNEDFSEVLLILKNRPDWQKGNFNGVGGHIEKNESPLQAMEREMLEETGMGSLDAIEPWKSLDAIEPWKLIAVGQCRMDAKLHIFANRANISEAYSTTDEMVSLFHVENLPSNIISNLTWLIPLAIDMLKNGLPPTPIHFSSPIYRECKMKNEDTIKDLKGQVGALNDALADAYDDTVELKNKLAAASEPAPDSYRFCGGCGMDLDAGDVGQVSYTMQGQTWCEKCWSSRHPAPAAEQAKCCWQCGGPLTAKGNCERTVQRLKDCGKPAPAAERCECGSRDIGPNTEPIDGQRRWCRDCGREWRFAGKPAAPAERPDAGKAGR